ncbi:MAG: hypothetical protein HYT10_03175 [Candidatus Levybacteria bacterium]|nr:hypothetical protein [Candidatus Levybacteria bacterium]
MEKKTIEKQIDDFIVSLQEYNALRPRPRRKKDYDFLRRFYLGFIKDRNSRSSEVESQDYRKVVDFARSLIPAPTQFNFCIDGRVMAIIAFGMSALMGRSIRTPGGMLRDFIRGKDGKLYLKKESMYGMHLLNAYTKCETDVLVEVFDSHLGCSARLSEEQIKGRMPQDFGLMADVSHKRQIAQAVVEFASSVFAGEKRVIPIQTSFDPHRGYIYMGLEKEDVFNLAREKAGGFTEEMLSELVDKNLIISTQRLSENEKIEKILADLFFEIDWNNAYINSADLFWKRIVTLRTKLGNLFEKMLCEIYPYLEKDTKELRVEKEQRLLLLLSNTLSGYLHNHREVTKDVDGIKPHMHEVHYPYGVHQEEGVGVSEGGYPPYAISLFAVSNMDEKNMAGNIALAVGLVRKNRLEGRVKDAFGFYSSVQEFVEASVPVVVQEVIRDTSADDHAWEKVKKINWNDLPENWDTMTDGAFMSYLHLKGCTQAGILLGINNLRKHMALLYNPTTPISSLLVEHYNVALPIVANRYRKNKFVVPFVKLGFS